MMWSCEHYCEQTTDCISGQTKITSRTAMGPNIKPLFLFTILKCCYLYELYTIFVYFKVNWFTSRESNSVKMVLLSFWIGVSFSEGGGCAEKQTGSYQNCLAGTTCPGAHNIEKTSIQRLTLNRRCFNVVYLLGGDRYIQVYLMT